MVDVHILTNKFSFFAGIMTLLAILQLSAGEQAPWDMWNMDELSDKPDSESAEGILASAAHIRWSESPGYTKRPEAVKAVWLGGPEYKGRATKIFAWVGVPDVSDNAKVPGMVLVHGGGGTAFAEWVAMWNRAGYAAIAIDTSGGTPAGDEDVGHEYSGPRNRGDFAGVAMPVKDQWTYHAVSAVIIANSYLRSLEKVDSDRIGLTGISWGGYLTCIAAGVDQRFKLAIPVYGCGFLGENSAWKTQLDAIGNEKREKWLGLWDPSVYIGRIKMPVLWVAFTNDTFYPMDSLQRSYGLLSSPFSLCILVNFGHSHSRGWSRPEITAFADSIFNPLRKTILPIIVEQGRSGQTAWLKFKHCRPLKQVSLCYTIDSGKWSERCWKVISLPLKNNQRLIKTKLPDGVKTYYFNVEDDRGMVVSSQHEEPLIRRSRLLSAASKKRLKKI